MSLTFRTSEEAKAFIMALRWPDGVRCVYCGSHSTCEHHELCRASRFQCLSCRKSFSPLTGTLFHHSKTDLRDWFAIIELYLRHTGTVDANALPNIKRSTVNHILQKLRNIPVNFEEQMNMQGFLHLALSLDR